MPEPPLAVGGALFSWLARSHPYNSRTPAEKTGEVAAGGIKGSGVDQPEGKNLAPSLPRRSMRKERDEAAAKEGVALPPEEGGNGRKVNYKRALRQGVVAPGKKRPRLNTFNGSEAERKRFRA